MKTYNQYLNESAGKKKPAMSAAAMKHIKEMCNEMLHNEAKAHDEDPHADHTYEAYMKECNEYMNECINECMNSYKK